MLQPVRKKKVLIQTIEIRLKISVLRGSFTKPINHIGKATINKVTTKTNNAQKAKTLKIKFFKFVGLLFYNFQSIGVLCCFINNSLVLEKCLQPKKPLLALYGEGCAAFKTKCFVSSISDCFSWANLPHNRKTIPSLSSEILLITLSVNCSQPIFAWLPGSFCLTVKDAFKSKTPCCAHLIRLPFSGISIPRSFFNSLKILFSDGGFETPSGTEKLKPCACPLL